MKKGLCEGPNADDSKSVRVGQYVKKKLVNKSRVEYATFGVNHGMGCLHMCKYCYGCQGAKAHGLIDSAEAWADLGLVENLAERLGRELDRRRTPVDRIHLSFITDPFMWDAETGQPVPEFTDATLDAVRAINDRGIPVTLLTKGIYPEIDARQLHADNHYGITVVSLSEDFRQEWEPGAPPVASRIEGLRSIAEQGAWTWVSVEPYPTPNIDPSAGDPEPLLEELRFIDKFIFGRLNYTKEVTEYLRSDREFYLRAARQVVSWCQANGKGLHIKKRTPLHRPETANILAVDERSRRIAKDAA
jgi:DNA repair photolyase